MVFRDQRLICEECGKAFFFTVTEQRRLTEREGTDEIELPTQCKQCRGGPETQPEREQPPPRRQPPPREQPAARVEPIREQVAAPVSLEDTFPLEEDGIEVKLIGTVKWFSREKGYGFITKADGQDLFFHRADLAEGEYAWPEEDQKVEFQIRQTEKGPEAFNVSILPTD